MPVIYEVSAQERPGPPETHSFNTIPTQLSRVLVSSSLERSPRPTPTLASTRVGLIRVVGTSGVLGLDVLTHLGLGRGIRRWTRP